MAAREVFDTRRQQELRQQIRDEHAAQVRAAAEAEAAQRRWWQQLKGRTIVKVETGNYGQALCLTLDNGRKFYVEPSEWVTYSLDTPRETFDSYNPWEEQ